MHIIFKCIFKKFLWFTDHSKDQNEMILNPLFDFTFLNNLNKMLTSCKKWK